ncbi:TIGR01777 family oxidoreductase [soil metagenome]
MSTSAHLPRLVIAGAGGLIGRHLLRLAEGRYDRIVLTHSDTKLPGVTSVRWDPRAAAKGDERGLARVSEALEAAAGLINLAGSSISAGRLDARHVATLRASRVAAGATLSEALLRCATPPAAWFQASGTNAYADGGEHELDESAPIDVHAPLGEVGIVWEASADPVQHRTRVVIGRMAMVLAPEAEAWRRLLLPIRLGVGGPLGSGRQWWPWIHVDDVVRAILWLVERDDAVGVYNVVAEPVRQIELTRAAARRLRRPALVPVPPFALRIVLGGLADALLLASLRVVPDRLLEEGFEFELLDVDRAVARLLA